MPIIKIAASPYYYVQIKRDGRQFRRSLGTKSRREAERLAKTVEAELEADITRAEIVAGRDLTLDEAAALYWSQVVTHRTPKTQQAYSHHLQRLLDIIGKTVTLSELRTAHVAAYVAKRQADGRAPATIKVELAILRAMHKRAQEVWDAPVSTIAWRSVVPKVDNLRFRTLTREQAIALGEALPQRLRPAYWWSIATGCRIKRETAMIRARDIDWTAKTVRITRKGGKVADLPLSDAAMQILERVGARAMEPDAIVFATGDHSEAMARARARTGLKDFHWHDLRHVHATWLRQSGVPIEVVQRLLGHRDITTTVSRYAHVEQQELHEGVARLELPEQEGER